MKYLNLTKNILNFFGSGDYDRLQYFREKTNWFENLDKKKIHFVPIWRGLNLFSNKNDLNPVFLNYSEIKNLFNDSHLKILLGCTKEQTKDKFYVCIDFSKLSELKINKYFRTFGIFLSLRDINPLVDGNLGSILAYSLAICNWHKNNLYCSSCGSKTYYVKAGHQRNCQSEKCQSCHFPRTDPAVIMLVYKGDKILLGRQEIWPKGMYSTLAGFVEPGETIENAVSREVFEEAGISIQNIQYHSSQPWPFPSSLMLGFYAEAKTTKIKIDEKEIEDVQWFTKDEIKNFQNQNKFLPRKISIARRLIDDWVNI